MKGQTLSLVDLLGGDEKLAKRYEHGACVIARLAPPDYHRFHFPFDCKASEPKLIKGSLFSVNPIALGKRLSYITENKRMLIRKQKMLE